MNRNFEVIFGSEIFTETRGVSYTVWKFHDFSIPQILREINFWDSKSAKTAIFAILGAVNLFCFGKNLLSKYVKIHKNQNSEALNMLKRQILHF